MLCSAADERLIRSLPKERTPAAAKAAEAIPAIFLSELPKPRSRSATNPVVSGRILTLAAPRRVSAIVHAVEVGKVHEEAPGGWEGNDEGRHPGGVNRPGFHPVFWCEDSP